MKYKPKKSYGAVVGLIMGSLIFGFCFWGIEYSLGPEDQALKILLYIPAYLFFGIYIALISGAFRLYYEIKEDRLVIRWGLISLHIPWKNIEHVVKVNGKSNLFSILGISWPGYIIGFYMAKGLGPVKMYATRPGEGFLYLKTSKGFFGLTPENEEMLEAIANNAGKEIEIVDMDEVPPEIKGKSLQEDNFYQLLFYLNVIFLLLFAGYLAVFYPGSGAPRFIILLLVLAVALFFFNIGNAGRLYQFNSQGGYILLIIGIVVTGIFLILSLSEISM